MDIKQPQIRYDATRTGIHGYWQCLVCQQIFHGGGAMHKEGCASTGFQDCVYVYGDSTINRLASGLKFGLTWVQGELPGTFTAMQILKQHGYVQAMREALEAYRKDLIAVEAINPKFDALKAFQAVQEFMQSE